MEILFDTISDGKILWTRFVGDLDDAGLLQYYQRMKTENMLQKYKRELVDGRQIGAMHTTAEGQQELAVLVGGLEDQLRGYRLAMVADSDLVFGMFRMWDMQRADLDYEVRVFRDYDEALAWLEATPV